MFATSRHSPETVVARSSAVAQNSVVVRSLNVTWRVEVVQEGDVQEAGVVGFEIAEEGKEYDMFEID